MIAIIGGGPAGIGMGLLLKQNGLKDFIIMEKGEIGSTFYNWPKETRFITPSFTAHGFGHLDLNAIVPETSPAYTFGKEHLTGEEYGDYLNLLADHFQLPIAEYTTVLKITRDKNQYFLQTNESGDGFYASSIIIACGEYHFPKKTFSHGIHYCEVSTWKDFSGDQLIIGGGESAADAAFHLAERGNKVDVYYPADAWYDHQVDPSRTLSPFTLERLNAQSVAKFVQEHPAKKVTEIKQNACGSYQVFFEDGECVETNSEPILCTGFNSGALQFGHLFEWSDEGVPLLTEKDESTTHPSVYLIGPNVRQKNTIFCFIYKFRQRFAVIADDIIFHHNLPRDNQLFQKYKQASMYLDDLSCCEADCQC
ncbi:NAD(P)/FAD-dependent oxidoreductase [Peribacillus loiseleuriae]|uniref:NAD(P)/FAD-dependent oxidoreductase n=1 Tax=Peribacillus loiseleuriae TaxID=1679170 RepID=UPI0037FC0424